MTTDQDLLVRFRAGDQAAFAALHDRHRPALVRYATRIAPEDAEDAVQEAFMRAHASLVRQRPRHVSAWLYTLVHNASIDQLRRRRGTRAAGVCAAAASAEDEALSRAAVREVVADVRELPVRQRRAVALVAIEGRSHKEIAAHLGTTVPGSRSLLKRARDNLVAMAAARALPAAS